MENGFLPICRADMEKRGWKEVDFVFVIGDAYVDHSSFGPAVISRLLEAHGYRVGILAQPDFRNEASVRCYGRPRLGFLVSAGNMDSMVNHYTVSKKRRHRDYYSPGGKTGRRPDRAVIVYGNLIRRSYPDVPVIIGGMEASLRRLAHYDYWSGSFRRSVLLESGADLLSYGMGEHSILEIAEGLNAGLPISALTYIRGTVYKTKKAEAAAEMVVLPSYQELCADKRKRAESFYIQYTNTDPFTGKTLVEPYGRAEFIVQNAPALPLSSQELDDVYELSYMGAYHPSYEKDGGVPALGDLAFSLTSSRGCFGGCSFCALTFHQGRIVQARSQESLLREARRLTEKPDFKGYIHDVGGPTANFRLPSCGKQLKEGVCSGRQCLFPKPCPGLTVDHSDYLSLLQKLRALPGVKKVFIRSGIRYDYLMEDPDDTFFREMCRHHVSGQLRTAPEHVSDAVLKRMGKPEFSVYRKFEEAFRRINREEGLNQYAVPYLMSSHPGSTMKEAVKLAEYIRDLGYSPEQVQDFYPTPSTLSTCMYDTGLDPRTMEPVYVPKSPHEKELQRALLQYRKPGNRALVEEALQAAGRTDLIGFGPKCLIRPEKGSRTEPRHKSSREERTGRKKTIRNVHRKKERKTAE